jgi:site-specific DNA-methyltransferase (adenine-specific)
MTELQTNVLYFGDNLEILRKYIPDSSIDLVYLDPPFNSKKDYNILFKENGGVESEAQIKAFTDTWRWTQTAQDTYHEIVTKGPLKVGKLIGALHDAIGSNDVMAYLVMMTIRLVELHRVLKPTGSLYLHCDPAASHYLKLVLDQVFGPANFRNEIIWKRTSAHSSAKRYGPVHDVLFYYAKSDLITWNPLFTEYDQEYITNFYKYENADGRTYRLSDLTGAGIRKGLSGIPWRGIDPTSKGRHWMYEPQDLERLDREGRVYWPPRGGVPAYKRYGTFGAHYPKRVPTKAMLSLTPSAAVAQRWLRHRN